MPLFFLVKNTHKLKRTSFVFFSYPTPFTISKMLSIKFPFFLVWALINASGLIAQGEKRPKWSDSFFLHICIQPTLIDDTQILPYKTPSCGHRQIRACKIPCYEDPKCQTLGFNVSIYSCACPAEVSGAYIGDGWKVVTNKEPSLFACFIVLPWWKDLQH